MADGTEEIDCSNSNGIDLDECSCFCGLPLCGPSVVQSSEDGTELDDSCFLDGCQQHRFHFMCIGLWAKRSNTCPLCKAKIKGATRVRDGECASFEDRVICPSDSLDEDSISNSVDDDDDDWLGNVVCCVCNSGDSEDTLLLCDGCSPNCGCATHVACAGLDSLPPMDQDWFCEKCRNYELTAEGSLGSSHSRSFTRPTARRRVSRRYRLNENVTSSGTRKLIRIMNTFEKRARKEARSRGSSGSRANYSASRWGWCSSSGLSSFARERGSFSQREQHRMRRRRFLSTKMEARLPMSNGSRVVESILEDEGKEGCYLETGMVNSSAVTESTEVIPSTPPLEKRIRDVAEQERSRGSCSRGAGASSTEVKDIISTYQRDGRTYKRPRRGIGIKPCDMSLKKIALLARECNAVVSQDLDENAIHMSSIGDVSSPRAIDISLELAKSILIRVGVTQMTVNARRCTLEFLSSLEGVSKDHLMRSKIGQVITKQLKSDDGDLIHSLLNKWLSLVV